MESHRSFISPIIVILILLRRYCSLATPVVDNSITFTLDLKLTFSQNSFRHPEGRLVYFCQFIYNFMN